MALLPFTTKKLVCTLTFSLAPRALGLLLIAGLVTVPSASQAADQDGTRVGGIITSNTTWTAAGSPYVLDQIVQVASNVTLRIEPGTVVDGNNVAPSSGSIFQVAGSLVVEGTADEPVVLGGRGASGVAGPLNNAPNALLSVEHARISGFDAIFPPSSGSGHANYVLSDSVVTGTTYMSYFWYPTSYARVERNLFVNAAALTFGTSSGQTATVNNNRFRGSSSSYSYKHWIESWAAYGSPLQVHGNSFERAGSPSPAMLVRTDGKIDASGNDWGTTDPVAVKARIRDKEDDLNLPSVVVVEPLLSGPAESTPTAAPTAPGAPAATAGDGQVTLSWSPPAEDGGAPVAGYEVAVSPSDRRVTVPAESTSTVIDGLSNGTPYTFNVTAITAVGASPASVSSGSITPAGTPEPPQQVHAIPGDGYMTVGWWPSDPNGSPVTVYTVTTLPGGQQTTTTSTSVDISGLTDGQAYRFTVSATNSVGTSAESEASPAAIAGRAPSPPGPVTAARRDRAIALSWSPATANGSEILGYLVTVQPGGRQIQVGGAGTTSYLVDGLRNGVAYSFTVAAASWIGYSAAQQSATVIPAGLPLRMAKPSASVAKRNVTIRWKAASANGSPISSYVVTRSGARPVVVKPGSTAVSFKSLRPGRYTFTVSARNSQGTSPVSAAVAVRIRKPQTR